MEFQRPSVIGIDIGGANLKYAAPVPRTAMRLSSTETAVAKSRFFPMWRCQHQLSDEIANDLRSFESERPIDVLAVTMTGELADCFLDRAEGVRHIVSQASEAAARLKIDEVGFYGVDGRFHDAETACANVDRIAAGNWHALASYIGRSLCSDGVLIDVGSTTTDIIPLSDGKVATAAQTDHDRLVEGSLVYIGGVRTPVATLVNDLLYQDQRVPVMNEWFATMDDVRIVLGLIPEDPDDVDTADGKPRTVEMAVNRLARMIGLDRRSVNVNAGISLAAQVHRAACRPIAEALDRVLRLSGNPNVVVISGHAPDLIELPQGVSVIQLSELLGQEVSRARTSVRGCLLVRIRASRAWSTMRRVVKVGGSLLDRVDLTSALSQWVDGQLVGETLVVVGGGSLVNAIRELDTIRPGDPVEVHWLCVDLLGVTFRLMSSWFDWPTVRTPEQLQTQTAAGFATDRPTLVAVEAFYSRELTNQCNSPVLPESWQTTTDAIAALLAWRNRGRARDFEVLLDRSRDESRPDGSTRHHR